MNREFAGTLRDFEDPSGTSSHGRTLSRPALSLFWRASGRADLLRCDGRRTLAWVARRPLPEEK